MFDWLKPKTPIPIEQKTVGIGVGNLTIDLPTHFVVEEEEDHTSVVYDPAWSQIALRFTTMVPPDPLHPPARELAIQNVDLWAKKNHQDIHKAQEVVYSHSQKPSQEDNIDGDAHVWVAAVDGYIVLVSCWVARGRRNHRETHEILSIGEWAVCSLRPARFQKFKYEGGEEKSVQLLTPEHVELLEQYRQATIDMARTVLGKASFTGGDSDLGVIQALLDHPNFDPKQTFAIEGLGIMLGGILARKLDLEWVSIIGENRSTPALRCKQANITLYPRDVIIKRIERGEKFDVVCLFNSLCEGVQKFVTGEEHL
jgi:hypothetical protein